MVKLVVEIVVKNSQYFIIHFRSILFKISDSTKWEYQIRPFFIKIDVVF